MAIASLGLFLYCSSVKLSFVYIVTSQRNGTLYLGVTSDLLKRAWQHRNLAINGFSKKYRCKRLVWYETHEDISEAIRKEKQMKKWKRAWKIRKIEEMNPGWRDLATDLEREDRSQRPWVPGLRVACPE